MICADTETAGLDGPIRLIGWYDGETYRVSESAQEFWESVRDRSDVCYFHNLEFDLAKLYRELEFSLQWEKALVLNNVVARINVRGFPLVFQDSQRILDSSLEKLCQSFALEKEVAKIDLDEVWKAGGYKSKEDYFRHVPVSDPTYREYLRHDVTALYELMTILRRYSGFDEETFLKIPSAASLALRVYKQRHPELYDILTEPRLKKEIEEDMRRAYVGARTNVFRTRLPDGGYHYDVNGLYGYVMGHYDYPRGYPYIREGLQAVACWNAYRRGDFKAILVEAVVEVEEQFIPPVPVRYESRLIFPIGRFEGMFVGAELLNAVRKGHTKILQIKKTYAWAETENYFREWADYIAHQKETSAGAERAFWKLVGNSLSGKFGMELNRKTIKLRTDEEIKKCREKGLGFEEFHPFNDIAEDYLMVDRRIFAPYVQPQVAAHITAYARLELLKVLWWAEEHGGVYYCDTDSVVTKRPLPAQWVDDSKSGKWKLEREISEAVFIQPKLYAERSKDGREVMKSKGLIRDFRETLTYSQYERILSDFEYGEHEISLYDGYLIRRHFVTAVKAGLSPDGMVKTRKKLRRDVPSNREMDWTLGMTRPLHLEAVIFEKEEQKRGLASSREESKLRQEERRRLWSYILPQGIRDDEYEHVPRGLKRKKGWALDVWADELGFENADELYARLLALSNV